MLRETVGVELIAPEKHFRWRGGRITRLEGFTDAVFAFAVTLLGPEAKGVSFRKETMADG